MRVRETVVRAIGNSAGVTIPKEILDRYDLAAGDEIFLQETPDGILITPHDPAFAEALARAADVAKRYRNALHALSTR